MICRRVRAASAPSASASSNSPAVILCVDDAAISRPPGREHLEARGHQLRVVADRAPRLAAARRRARERGRIDRDHVELPLALDEPREHLERVADDVLGLLGVEARRREVPPRPRVRLRRHVDGADLRRAARLRRDADRSGVREQVQHPAIARPHSHGAAALPQIREQAGRQRRGHVDDELEIVLGDLELDRRRVAAHELGGGLTRRLAAERAIAPLLVDRRRRELADDRVVELLAQVRDRRREQLHDEVTAVAIDDDPGQPVGLAVDHPHRAELGAVEQACAQRDRCLDPIAHELRVDRDVRVTREHAQRDRLVAVEQAAADELALVVHEVDHRAGLGRERARPERLPVHPRVAGAHAMRDVGREPDRVLAYDRRAAVGSA